MTEATYSYQVACLQIEYMQFGREMRKGGCGTFPLHAELAKAGKIACPHCRADWPDVKLLVDYPSVLPPMPDAPPAGRVVDLEPEEYGEAPPAWSPAPLKQLSSLNELRAAPKARKGGAKAQGDLFG